MDEQEPLGRKAGKFLYNCPMLGSDSGQFVSLDARVLAQECLKEVGRELGVPR
jgi:hypothetical protein